MINLNDVFLIMISFFRDLGWDKPNGEDYKLLTDVITELNECVDCSNHIDQEVQELREYLCDQYLNETESRYDKRGRAVIDIAVDCFEMNI